LIGLRRFKGKDFKCNQDISTVVSSI